jgi:hypothetical protein
MVVDPEAPPPPSEQLAALVLVQLAVVVPVFTYIWAVARLSVTDGGGITES